MKKVFLNILIVFFCFSFVVTSVSAAECCYSPSIGGIVPNPGSCSEDEVSVGNIAQKQNCDYESKRQVCERNNACYEKVAGYPIYDFDEIKSFFTNKGYNLDNYCEDLIDYRDGCEDNYNPGGSGSDPGTGSGSGGSSNGGDPSNQLNPQNPDPTPPDNEDPDIVTCSNIGGPFGFFLNKQVCESVDNNGVKTCIYNPYLSGKLKTFSVVEGDTGVLRTENGCMAKSQIGSCFDYKTKENCENNPVYNDENYANQNLKYCEWVGSSEFFTDFSVDTGVCISAPFRTENSAGDEIVLGKNANFKYLPVRKNVLRSSSFEDEYILDNWNFDGDYLLLENQDDAFNGKNYIRLLADTKISQKIFWLGYKVQFSSFLYLKQNTNYEEGDKIYLRVIENYENKTSQDFDYIVGLDYFNRDNQTFEKVIFRNHNIQRTNIESVDFVVFANKDIEIDALNFEIVLDGVVDAEDVKYKPISILDSRASSCELCFENDMFNLCNEDKSETLGDCSFMVDEFGDPYFNDDLTSYVGKKSNKYYDNWTSTSFVNSKLFCEMYVTENTCTNLDNYVNKKFRSFHPLLEDGVSLCSWNDVYGCYKDSDVSRGPDVIDGSVFLGFKDISKSGWDGTKFRDYVFESVEEVGESDFAYGCDVMPPQAYLFFRAKNASADVNIITGNFPDEVLGAVSVELNIQDFDLESCDEFDIENRLYLDFIVNGKTYYKNFSSNSVEDNIALKELLVDENEELLLVDGLNDIDFMIKDQSGNVGYKKHFDLNGDFAGPVIDLQTDIKTILGPNQKLVFDIHDGTKVESCEFVLKPFLDSISSENYIGNGDFFNETFTTKLTGTNYEFKIPVNKTGENVEMYSLTMTCDDIFEQETQKEFYLQLDYNASLIVLEPIPFTSYLGNLGFLNQTVEFNAVSIDQNIESCKFIGDGIIPDTQIELVEIEDGFILDSYSDDVLFYTNITGKIGFTTQGKHDIKFECEDSIGNKHQENLIYYYDTQKPTLETFEVLGVESNEKNLFEKEGKFYVRKLSQDSQKLDIKLNVSLDGSSSWMSSENLSIVPKEKYIKLGGVDFVGPNLDDTTFIGDLLISNFVNLMVYEGKNTSEDNLKIQTYNLSFKDKSGNKNINQVEFYYDKSEPEFVFDADVHRYDGVLYTNQINPNIKLSFNTPSYREYACNVSVEYKGNTYLKKYPMSASLSFDMDDIVNGFEFVEEENVKMILSCNDVYNSILSSSFDLRLDKTEPILDSVYFDGGNNKYLLNNGPHIVYPDLEDRLVFDFTDTNEVMYKCEYKFTSSDYICNSEWFDVESPALEQGYILSDLINIVSTDNDDSVCVRRNDFFSMLEYYNNRDQDYKTQINVKAKCFDVVNHETVQRSVNYDVLYISGGGIVDFDYGIVDGAVEFEVSTVSPYDKVVIAFDIGGEDVLTQLIASGKDDKSDSYKYISKISLDEFENYPSSITLWALAYTSGDELADGKSKKLTIDAIKPEVELKFPDADEEDKIYSENFEVLVDVEDFRGEGIRSINMFIENDLVYEYHSNGSYNVDAQNLQYSGSDNYFNSDKKSFQGRVVYHGASIGDVLDFKLEAVDEFGNKQSVLKVVNIVDGLNIRLMDSENAKVDYLGTQWWTRESLAPKIKFRTSRKSDYCSIYPFYDDKWKNVLEDPLLQYSSEEIYDSVIDNIYDLDLNTLNSFNLDKVEDNEVVINIRCKYNQSFYDFQRVVKKVDLLPDYVLTSSNGFFINSGDFKTDVEVKSVGANRYVKCQYKLENSEFEYFDNDLDSEFFRVFDFSNYATNDYNMEIRCMDIFGVFGPTKSYEFRVNQNDNLEISDVRLVSEVGEFELSDDNRIYIPNIVDSYDLVFNLNKNGDVACSYEVGGSSSIIDFIINLFKSRIDIENSELNSFEYLAKQIKFSDSNSILKIVCSDPSSNKFEYEVVYQNELDYNIDLRVN